MHLRYDPGELDSASDLQIGLYDLSLLIVTFFAWFGGGEIKFFLTDPLGKNAFAGFRVFVFNNVKEVVILQ